MCGIDGDRRQQRIEFPFAVVVDERQCLVIQFVDAEDANSLLGQFRRASRSFQQEYCSSTNSWVGAIDQFPLLDHGQAVGRGRVVAVFQLLQQAADPDFEEFVEIAGRDRQEFHALEQRDCGGPRLLPARAS